MPTLDAATTSSQGAARLSGDEALLTWRVHRLRENPAGAYLVAAAYAAAFIFWRMFFPQPLALILPLFAMTGALSDYLFPATYKLTANGAYADCGASRLFIPWPDVKRATFGSDGVYLSPFAHPSRLDSFRGVRLKFGYGNRECVLNEIRRLRQGNEAPA